MAGVKLFRGAAFFADEKNRGARAGADIAGDEGVEAFDAMREAQARKEIERAVDCRRLGDAFVAAEQRQQVVSLGWPVMIQEQFKHAAAQRREAFARSAATAFGFLDLRT